MSRRSGQETRLSASANSRVDAVRLRRLVGDCARRRAAGEVVTDEEIIRANPDLMPSLERELTLLRIMQRAASHVADSRRGSSGGGSADRTLVRPDAIPGYTLLRELHRGGQGVVYEAEQASTGRRVAVKLLHRGPFASASDRARFQREVSLLIRLRHPNIVAIHDTGRVGNSHYIVMDLIEGLPLDRYVETLRGSRWTPDALRRMLVLLSAVCDAVHAAHLRGIIHRDLKPSNVLIDPGGGPHILDFGLAKDTTDAASDLTNDGQFVGSVPWASPEQVSGAADADMRTDVYSLGVVIFEALTGRFPYGVTGPIADVFGAIKSAEPLRPRALRPELGAEIDFIVLKCLSKDQVRRYESAGELARDLRRHLAGEPIEARRDSTFYVFSKHLRRYRRVAFAVAAVIVGLTGFAVYAGIQARQQHALAKREFDARVAAQDAQIEAQRQQSVAARERDEARRARDAEATQRTQAELQAERAAAVTEFLVDTLGLANPDVTQISDMSMRTMLDSAAAQVGRRFSGQPESEATVRLVIGRAYAALGASDEARDHLGRALAIREVQLESDPAALYEVLWPYVQVLDDLGAPEWRDRWWQLWRLYPQLLSLNDAEFMGRFRKFSALMDSAFERDDAEPVRTAFKESAAAVIANDDARWITVADFLHLGGANLAFRDFADVSRPVLLDALEIERRYLPETHTRIIRTLGALVRSSIDAGKYSEAESLTRESLSLLRRTLPDEHWYISATQARLGACLIGQRRYDEAERLLLDNLPAIEASLGSTSAFAREIVERLIDLYDAWERSEAAAEWRHSLAVRMISSDQYNRPERQLRRLFDAQERDVFDALSRFNRVRATSEGREALRKLVPLAAKHISATDPRSGVIAECLCSGANAIADRNRVTAATLEMMQAAEPLARASAELHPRKRAWIYWNLARNLVARRGGARAEALCREALQALPTTVTELDSLRLEIRGTLGLALVLQNNCELAEPILTDVFERQLATLGANHNATRETMLAIVRLYQSAGQVEAALPFAVAVAEDRWLEWWHVEPILAGMYPDIDAEIDALRAIPAEEVDRIAASLNSLLALRQTRLNSADPAALLYAHSLHSVARRGATPANNPVWISAFCEIMDITKCHLPPDWRGLGTINWRLSTLYNRAGSYEAAMAEALDATTIAAAPSRDALRGAAAGGLGWVGEAEPLLASALAYFGAGNPPREPYFSECFAALLDLHLCTGQVEAAARLVQDVLEAEIARRSNAPILAKLSSDVGLRPGLAPAAYETARKAAEVALELRKENPSALLFIAAANLRLDRFEDAAVTLRKISVPPIDVLSHLTLLAIAEAALGNAEAAAVRLAAAEQRLLEHPASTTSLDRRLIDEARRRVGSQANP